MKENVCIDTYHVNKKENVDKFIIELFNIIVKLATCLKFDIIFCFLNESTDIIKHKLIIQSSRFFFDFSVLWAEHLRAIRGIH